MSGVAGLVKYSPRQTFASCVPLQPTPSILLPMCAMPLLRPMLPAMVAAQLCPTRAFGTQHTTLKLLLPVPTLQHARAPGDPCWHPRTPTIALAGSTSQTGVYQSHSTAMHSLHWLTWLLVHCVHAALGLGAGLAISASCCDR